MAEYGNDIISLTDELGNELQFEVIVGAEVDGETYLGLVEVFDDPQKMLESDAQLVVMKQVEDAAGEVVLVTLDSNEELAKVVKEFEAILDEEYELDDTEGEA